MAPSWVLLHRKVGFVDGRAGGKSNDGEGSTGGAGKEAAAIGASSSSPSPWEATVTSIGESSGALSFGDAMVAAMRAEEVLVKPSEAMVTSIGEYSGALSAGDAMVAAMRPEVVVVKPPEAMVTSIGESSGPRSAGEAMVAAMRPEVVVVKPPEVSRLLLKILHTGQDRLLDRVLEKVHDCKIASTHQGLVVLYTGVYGPGRGYSTGGCYLVYDATYNSLSTIPPLPDSIPNPVSGSPDTIEGLGLTTAAILRHSNGDYIVAELVTTSDTGLPNAELFLWCSSSTMNPSRQWMRRPVRLPLPPELSGPKFLFNIDMVFLFGASCVCWVDLLTGLLICDLSAPHEPGFRFITLPQGSQMYTPDNCRLRLRPEEFRSMGCVGSAINFVALIGHLEGLCAADVAMKTWKLSPDLEHWTEDSVLLVGDLWATERFKAMQLPRVRLICPILSSTEEGVICVSLNDIEKVKETNEYGDIVGSYPKLNAHYMLLVDLPRGDVISSKMEATTCLQLLMPHILASDLCSHLHLPGHPTATTVATKRAEAGEEDGSCHEEGGSSGRSKHSRGSYEERGERGKKQAL